MTVCAKRVKIIKNMQALAWPAFFLCVLCIFVLFAGYLVSGKLTSISLLLMMISLGLSFWEILLSSHALTIELSDMQKKKVVVESPPTSFFFYGLLYSNCIARLFLCFLFSLAHRRRIRHGPVSRVPVIDLFFNLPRSFLTFRKGFFKRRKPVLPLRKS
ncbi:MAG: DUF2721 domain-containing protein [Desulfobacterales bacterium]